MCTTSNSLKITFLNVCGIKYLINPDIHVNTISHKPLFNPMFSDIHNQLHFVVSLNEYAPLQNEKVYVQHNHIRWNENKADEFRQALMDSVLLGEINTALDNFIGSNCITADQVNTIVNHLGSLFIHSANGISKNRHNSGKSKPWFNKGGKCFL